MKTTTQHTESIKHIRRYTLDPGVSYDVERIDGYVEQNAQRYGRLFRGITADWQFVDQIGDWDKVDLGLPGRPVSTSTDESIADGFSHGGDVQVIFRIRKAEGADISGISENPFEDEVLLKSGTYGFVTGKEEFRNKVVLDVIVENK